MRARREGRKRPEGAGIRPPAAWEESRPRNLSGRVSALTTFNAVGPFAAPVLRIGFLLARSNLLARLYIGKMFPGLSFIHVARWVLVRDIPSAGGGRTRLRPPYLLFETNFNGSFDQYIDAFAYILTSRIANIWRRSYGFPGPTPAGPFKAFIRRQEFEASHYYAAYPEATATTVLHALLLRPRLRVFAREAEGLDPETFALRYARFLTDVQRLI